MVPIEFDGKGASGVVTSDGFGLRVKLAAEEFDRLGLAPGRPVKFAGAGQAGTFLLTAAEEEPPYVWVGLLPMAC